MLNLFKREYWRNLVSHNQRNLDRASAYKRSLSTEYFIDLTYSKKHHFDQFKQLGYDIELFGESIDPEDCNLKVYQDLCVFSILKHEAPPGSRILDIGGGDSRILKHFKSEHECWNLDKLEGLGNGPTQIDASGFKLVTAYIGEFSDQLRNDYFDYVFSISTLEHVPQQDRKLHANILKDINRVLKPEGVSLHLFDCVMKGNFVWANPLLRYLFENAGPINDFIPLETLHSEPELYFMSEKFYEKSWQHTTGKSYQEFGSPFSYNICWRK